MRLCACKDTAGECFARTKMGGCRILVDPDKKCSYKKAVRQVTHGVYYPDRPRTERTEGETDE